MIIRADSTAMPLGDETVDAVVCDPPYGLEFMGKDWDTFRVDPRSARWSGAKSGGPGFGATPDGSPLPNYGHRRTTSLCRTCGKRDAFRNPHACDPDADWRRIYVDIQPIEMRAFQEWTRLWAVEAYRVAKPGAHMLAFGGPRTYHRLASGVEDAGWEIRDCLMWMYGSGFPKSHNISFDLDVAEGVTRDVVRPATRPKGSVISFDAATSEERADLGPAVSEIAIRWEGWGSALKPGYEPIVLARKPLIGTIAANVREFGTGALNIDGTRIAGTKPQVTQGINSVPTSYGWAHQRQLSGDPTEGRWPANLMLDGEAADLLEAETPADRPSRFYYTAKTSRREREAGLDAFTPAIVNDQNPPGSLGADSPHAGPGRSGERRNDHPTVKRTDVMRWLCRLITPPDGLVLDPFVGSGTTGMAALDEGFRFVGIDREPRWSRIARARIQFRHEFQAEPIEPTAEVEQGRML